MSRFRSILMAASICILGSAQDSRLSKYTGAFSNVVDINGTFYGYKIVIYQYFTLHAIFIDADFQTQLITDVSINDGLISFSVPNDIDPTQQRTFTGKVTKNGLVGSFDNSGNTLKLLRCKL